MSWNSAILRIGCVLFLALTEGCGRGVPSKGSLESTADENRGATVSSTGTPPKKEGSDNDEIATNSRFTLEGKLSGLEDGAVLKLSYIVDGRPVELTATAKNGSFNFQGDLLEPTLATLEVVDESMPPAFTVMTPNGPVSANDDLLDRQQFFLEGGKVVVTGDSGVKQAEIVAGKSQTEYTELLKRTAEFENELKAELPKVTFGAAASEIGDAAPIRVAGPDGVRGGNDNENINGEFEKRVEIRNKIQAAMDEFFMTHPDSFVTLHFIQYSLETNPAHVDIYLGLSERVRKSVLGQRLGAVVAKLVKIRVGEPAIDFTLNDTSGDSITLSKYRGQFVLIDFWASWCGPCRLGNPDLVRAFKRFKGKNLNFIAVSLDDDKDAWLAAIEKDELTDWIHVSDFKAYEGETVQAYGINAIPRNFLVDPNGIIVAKNLHGDEIEKVLAEFLPK